MHIHAQGDWNIAKCNRGQSQRAQLLRSALPNAIANVTFERHVDTLLDLCNVCMLFAFCCVFSSSPMARYEPWFPAPSCTPPALQEDPSACSDPIPFARDPAPTLRPRASPGYKGLVPNFAPTLAHPSSPLPPEARRVVLQFLHSFSYSSFWDQWQRARITGRLHGVRPFVARGAPLPQVPR